MSITNEKLEMLVADCNLLRSKNSDLMNQIQEINNHLYQMEQAIKVLHFKEVVGILTEQGITDIISELDLEQVITSHIHERTDWNDVIKVDLSLSGNEIETEIDADRWEIERYIARDLSSVLEESIREMLQNFTTKQEVQNDSI
jgi:hypothetical protein